MNAVHPPGLPGPGTALGAGTAIGPRVVLPRRWRGWQLRTPA